MASYDEVVETQQNLQVGDCIKERNIDKWIREINSNINDKLEEKIKRLKNEMKCLREELEKERNLWKKEVEAVKTIIATQKNESEEKAEQVPESKLIKEYEEKIMRYEGALAQVQVERRNNIRRQIAADTYKKRLSEVEKLCEEELAKVKQSVSSLEPLKQMASEWQRKKPETSYKTSASTSRLSFRTNEEQDYECKLSDSEQTVYLCKESLDDGLDNVQTVDTMLIKDDCTPQNIGEQIIVQISNPNCQSPIIRYTTKLD